MLADQKKFRKAEKISRRKDKKLTKETFLAMNSDYKEKNSNDTLQINPSEVFGEAKVENSEDFEEESSDETSELTSVSNIPNSSALRVCPTY
jgi:hypothetical protein